MLVFFSAKRATFFVLVYIFRASCFPERFTFQLLKVSELVEKCSRMSSTGRRACNRVRAGVSLPGTARVNAAAAPRVDKEVPPPPKSSWMTRPRTPRTVVRETKSGYVVKKSGSTHLRGTKKKSRREKESIMERLSAY